GAVQKIIQQIVPSHQGDLVISTAHIANPERGWFYSIGAWSNNDLQPFPSAAELANMRSGNDKITLVRRYYLLDDFLNGPISQSLLNQFQSDCDALRAAGFKLIPRFSYNWSYGLPQLDPTVSRAHQHLEQLRPYLANNEDIIAHVEAGFIGHFGEWHNSSENHVDNFTLAVRPGGHAILDSLLKATPQSRMVATRYYYHNKMKYLENYHGQTRPVTQSTAFGGGVAARIGTHNDAIMFDADWMWHHDSIPQQRDYADEDLQWVVTSGEPLPSSFGLSNNPMPELSFLRFNSLAMNANIEGGTDLYDYWKAQGYYDELTLQLGHRYQLREATIDNEVEQNGRLRINLELDNVGFASLYNPRTSELIFRTPNQQSEFSIDITSQLDLRYLQNGSHTLTVDIPIPSDLETGAYDLYLHFPDASPRLRSDPRYSIQLANQGTWESATGYNSLQHRVSVVSLPLPLDLLAFTGKAGEGRSVELHWQTQNEIHVHGFELERRLSSGQWKSIDFLPSKGNAAAGHAYAYTDATAEGALAYYRLKMLDQDGTFSYSAVIAVPLSNQTPIRLYPSLVKGEFRVEGKLDNAMVKIYDGVGVERQAAILTELPVVIDASQLPSGTYYVLIFDRDGQMRSRHQIVKQ
ncbi:MAG: DUF4874 domain-containing protein, partial [Bacteroidota bacterium]